MRRGLAVVAALTSIALGLLLVSGRSSDPPTDGSESDRHVSPADDPRTQAHGPRRTAEQTEEGARDAAIRYATASQDWLYLSDAEIDQAVRAIATPATAATLSAETVSSLRSARESLSKSPGRVWWLVRPLASKLERFNGASARVVVWTVTILSAADVALPQADWTRIAVDLVWVDGGWRVDAISDSPGPTPMTGTRDRPWQPEPFDDALDEFQRVDSEVSP